MKTLEQIIDEGLPSHDTCPSKHMTVMYLRGCAVKAVRKWLAQVDFSKPYDIPAELAHLAPKTISGDELVVIVKRNPPPKPIEPVRDTDIHI